MNDSFTWQEFQDEINKDNSQINLAKGALLISKIEYKDLDINEYLKILDYMGEEVKDYLPSSSYPLKIIQGINKYLFENLQFTGNLENYYDIRNSFLNDVITRCTGIPITLSLIYLEIAKRINFPMFPISMPGHFLIKPDFENAEIFVDTFNKGEILFPQDCEERLRQVYQQPLKMQPEFLEPVEKKQVLTRILNNMKLIYINNQNLEQVIQIITGILILNPDNYDQIRDRGIVYYQLGKINKACDELEKYITLAPDATDNLSIQQLLWKIKS